MLVNNLARNYDLASEFYQKRVAGKKRHVAFAHHGARCRVARQAVEKRSANTRWTGDRDNEKAHVIGGVGSRHRIA